MLFRLVVGTVTVRGVVGPLGSPAELTKLRLILRKVSYIREWSQLED